MSDDKKEKRTETEDTSEDVDTGTETPVKPLDASSPVTTPDATAAAEPAAAPAVEEPAIAETPPPSVAQEPQSAAPETPSIAQQPAAPAAPAQIQPAAAPVPLSPTPTAQDFDAQHIAYAQDLATRQIKPESYQNLFANKSTLGKIGTFFGLLLSGAGSGLGHQPNALLDMMNKEIDRDLDAQKQNRGNAQNFLNLAYQHELQQAQIKRTGFENQKIAAETGLLPVEAQLKAAQAAALPAEARLHASQANALDAENAGLAARNQAKNYMLTSAYQSLVDQNANNPAGQEMLKNKVGPAIQQQVGLNNQQSAARVQLNSARQSQQGQQQSDRPTAIDVPKMQKLINLGKTDPDVGISPGEAPQVRREAQEAQDNRVIAKAYDDTFKRLDSAFAAGKLNPKLRAAELATLGATIARDTTGRYNAGEAMTQASGIFPETTDYGAARAEKYRKFMDSLRGKESGLTTLDSYDLKTPFPDYSFTPGSKKSAPAATPGKAADSTASNSAPSEGTKTMSKSGRPLVFTNGNWIYDTTTPKSAMVDNGSK